MKRLCLLCTAIVLTSLSGTPVTAQANPVPFVSQSLVPASVKPGSAAFTLTVNGTGFAPTSVVSWNGSTRLTEVLSSRQLKASISAADVAKAGTASITVTNPVPGGGTSNPIFFPIRPAFSNMAMAVSQPFPTAGATVVGDFNNDGIADVAWAGAGGLNVSFGKGNGTFAAPISTSTSFGISQMVTGDFNGDGKLDIAAVDFLYAGVMQILLGNGDGTFSLGENYVTSGENNLIAAADFNGDGHLDLYVTGLDLGNQWFQILLGNGDGTFRFGQQVFVSYFASLPAIGDFNGDGILDLAIPKGAGDLPQGVDIFLGNGDGTFHELGSYEGGASYFATAADMNHDGKLDLVTDHGCILLGKGDGTFSLGGCGLSTYNEGQLPIVGDFNGDGKLDAVLLSQSASPGPLQALILLGAGNGTFSRLVQIPAGEGYGGYLGAVGDFNNDGMLDLVTGDGYLLLQTPADVLPTSLSFGDQNVGTSSKPLTAKLANVAASALTINKISLAGSNVGSFTQTNNCGTSLAAASACTVTVTFKPTAATVLTASVLVNYAGTGSPQMVALTGFGLTPPTVTLKPGSLKFPTQLVGTTSSAQTVTLTNTGDQNVDISGFAITGPFTLTHNCPSILDTGTACTIQILFKPKAAGAATGTLSVTDNASGTPQKVALSGAGSVISFSPIEVNFGNQKVGTTSAAAPITLTNNGASAVSITQVAITGTNALDFKQTNNCGKSVAAHKSCTITATFKPTATGTRSAAVSVTDSGGGSPQSVALTGTGQ